MDRLSELQASPDGRRLVFTRSALDPDGTRRRTDIWMVGADGAGLRALTTDPASDTSPQWHPDNRRVFFLSSRSGSSQVWSVDAQTGTAAQVTSLPLDVGAFRLSRDGTSVAVALEVFVECDTLACTTARLEAKQKNPSSGEIFDRLFVRHWDAWSDGRRSHLFVLPIAGGPPVDVMKGLDADAPSKPFGGPEEFTFTPDGTALVFAARDEGRAEAWSTNLDLFVAPIDGRTAPSEPDRAERGHRHCAVLLAGWQVAGVDGDDAAAVPVRPPPIVRSCMAGRPRASRDRRAGTARSGKSSGPPTAGRSTRRRTTSGKSRSSPSTSRAARCARS